MSTFSLLESSNGFHEHSLLEQKQNTTRIINYTTRKQTHEFTIWKLYYFMCLNYSPMLSTNLQSSNLITQRVKIKFHG